MSEKTEVNLASAYRLLHPMHTVLVSCVGRSGKPNIITLAWAMPTSGEPPLVAISISRHRHSHQLIVESKEFVVNIPTMEILKQTAYCGRSSGRDRDKFKEAGLTALPAEKVRAPLIKECVAHLECKLHGQHTTGDHTVFVGEVVAARANKDAFKNVYNLKKARMIFHVGDLEFATLEPETHVPKP